MEKPSLSSTGWALYHLHVSPSRQPLPRPCAQSVSSSNRAQISDDFGIVATPLSWLFPIPLLQANGVFIQGEKHYAALGIVALFLSGVGWYKNRSALTFLWMTLLVVFALLALGTGKQQQLGIPLPFDAATLLLPEDTDIIHRYRAIVISTLAVSILGGLGADSLPKRFCWGIWVICLAERLLPLPVPIQTEVVHLPRVYVDLSQEEEYYGIIEFPCDILSPKDLHPEYFALLNQLNQRQLFYQFITTKVSEWSTKPIYPEKSTERHFFVRWCPSPSRLPHRPREFPDGLHRLDHPKQLSLPSRSRSIHQTRIPSSSPFLLALCCGRRSNAPARSGLELRSSARESMTDRRGALYSVIAAFPIALWLLFRSHTLQREQSCRLDKC